MMSSVDYSDKSGKASALKRVVRGAGAVFGGSLGGAVLQFVSGVVVIRILSQSDYGAYALAFSLTTIASLLAMLGLADALPQNIARYVADDRPHHVWGTIVSGFFAVIIGAAILSALLFFGRGSISSFFGKPVLGDVLGFLALLLPPFVLSQFMEATFRGLHLTTVKVWFNELGLRSLRILGLVGVIFLGGGLVGVLWVTVVSYYVVAVALMLYAARRLPSLLPAARPRWMVGSLLAFALPLLGVSIVNIVMTSSSTLLLGYLMSASTVALYSAPLPLSRFISLPLTALTFLYLPVATAAVRSRDGVRLDGLYHGAARWAALLSLPLVVVFILDPAFVLMHILGARYVASAGVLRILAIGFFIHCAMGPNGMTLLAFGGRRTLLVSVIIAAVTNVALGLGLIPGYRAEGAAAASAVALGLQNFVVSAVLWRRHSVRPFASGQLRTIVLPVLLSAGLYAGASIGYSASIGLHITYYMVVTLLCLASPFVFRTATSTDVDLLKSLERRLTGRSTCSERLLRWCVR